MKRLTCEMCGSTDLVKQDGVFVCQSCGCKYSVEEARKMMVEIDGPVEVTGTVKVDNSAALENYLAMAKTACSAGNYQETENYCNKIIEIDPNRYEAWLLKGKAAGWQTTMLNIRLSEAVSSFITSFQRCPEGEKEDLRAEIKEEFLSVEKAIVAMHAKQFVLRPTESNENALLNDYDLLRASESALAPLNLSFSEKELVAPICEKLNQTAVQAYQDTVLPSYSGNPNDPNDKPNRYRFQNFIEQGLSCFQLIAKAFELSPDDAERCLPYLENMIRIQQDGIDACSWKYRFENGRKTWEREYVLLDSAKASRRETIQMCRQGIAHIKEEKKKREQAEKEARIAAYWSKHQEEKAAIAQEKQELQAQLSALNEEYRLALRADELNEARKQIDDLKKQRDALGLFKRKEKGALQEKIDALRKRIDEIEKERTVKRKALQEKIDRLRLRDSALENELTKDRGQEL